MEPIIYELPIINEIINLDSNKFHYEPDPSPKLIKYGYNTINEQIDIASITTIPQYRASLRFDFQNEDENNMTSILSKTFLINKVDATFAEFWEILTLFGFFETELNIATNHPEIIENIVKAYQSITGEKNQYEIISIKSNKKKNDKIKTLVIFKYSDSEIDLDENAAIDIILDNLNVLLDLQNQGSNMILQLFDLQTQTSIELIYYLCSLYERAYLFQPLSTFDLSDSKYIIITGMKNINSIAKFTLNKNNDDLYLISFGIQNISHEMTMIIQCMNSYIIPRKYIKYKQIEDYLSKKVYEGATYNEMITIQKTNSKNWIELFSNIQNTRKMIDQIIQRTMEKCSSFSKLLELYK